MAVYWEELSYWLSAYAVLLYCVLIVCVPFLFGVWDRMWNSIVSVFDHCRFIYFVYILSFLINLKTINIIFNVKQREN